MLGQLDLISYSEKLEKILSCQTCIFHFDLFDVLSRKITKYEFLRWTPALHDKRLLVT